MLEMALLAIGLGADAFSVALGVGAKWTDTASRVRLSLAFGLFQFAMPLAGWQLGAPILRAVSPWERLVAAAVLATIATKMLWESFKHDDEKRRSDRNPTTGWPLIVLSIATSIDALAAGVTFTSLPGSQVAYAALIGVVTATMTAVAMVVARRAALRWGVIVERLGALVIIAVAVKVVVA